MIRTVWLIAGLVLCILIQWTCASPIQRNTNSADDEDDDLDSDEDEMELALLRKVITNRLGIQNSTQQQLAQTATNFIVQYLAGMEAKKPEVVTNATPTTETPNPFNHTIIISIIHGMNDSNVNNTWNTDETTTTTTKAPVEILEAKKLKLGNFPFSLPFSPVTEILTTPPTPSTPGEVKEEQGVDNIEDAILEALLFAQEPTQAPLSNQPGHSNNIQQNGSSVTPSVTNQRPLFINSYNPPVKSKPAPDSPDDTVKTIGSILGNLVQGDIGGVVENTVKLTGTGLFQNILNGVNCGVFQLCDKQPTFHF